MQACSGVRARPFDGRGRDTVPARREREREGGVTPAPGRRSVLEFLAEAARGAGRRLLGPLLALRERERRLRALADSVPDLLIYLDPQLRIRFSNHRCSSWFGRPAGELRGRHLRGLLGEDAFEAVREGLEAALGGETVHRESRIPLHGGEPRFVSASFVPDIESRGPTRGVVVTMRDVTEVKRTEAARTCLAEAGRILASIRSPRIGLQELADLAASTLGGLCMVHLREEGHLGEERGRVVLLAAAASSRETVDLLRDLGRRFSPSLQAEEGPGRVLRTGQASLYPEVTASLLRAMTGDDEELRALESLRLTSMVTAPLSAIGKTLGALTIASTTPERRYDSVDLSLARDLGRRAGLAVDRSLRLQESERANRGKNELLAMVSHDLRTPLNAILNWVQVLRTVEQGRPEGEEAIQAIERNAASQAKLIEELLELARLRRGKLELQIAAVDLARVVAKALDPLLPFFRSKEIHLVRGLDFSVPPVAGDAGRLEQVTWNLLSNAINFTPAGGTVEVRLERRGSEALLVVKDNGKGIAPEFLPHVFEPFRQAKGGARGGGLGLGLAIVRQLVDLHGGTVTAESEGEGLGAAFTVKLPLAPSSIPGAGAGEEEEEGAASLSGLRVLVALAPGQARAGLVSAIRDCEAEVEESGSLEEALARVEAFAPEVLLAGEMTGGGPRELLRSVRRLEDEHGRSIPAAEVGPPVSREALLDSLEAGFQMYLPLPAGRRSLLQALARLARMRVNG